MSDRLAKLMLISKPHLFQEFGYAHLEVDAESYVGSRFFGPHDALGSEVDGKICRPSDAEAVHEGGNNGRTEDIARTVVVSGDNFMEGIFDLIGLDIIGCGTQVLLVE